MQRIGDWWFDPLLSRLQRNGEARHLDPKEVSVLAHLAEAAPNPVSIEELLDRSWPGVVVGDNAVHQVVGRLRKALGDSAHNSTYIETLPKRGYRLLVVPASADGPAPTMATRWRRPSVWLVLLALAAAAGGYSVWTMAPPPASVLVRSFSAHSHDPELLHLARGFEDEIVHAIARNPVIVVVGPSLLHDPEAASIVVSGRLRAAGAGRARISMLAETLGRAVWSRSFDIGTRDPVADQIEVADQVSITVASINQLLSSLRRTPSGDRAVVALLRGRLLNGSQTLEGARASVAYFDQAIQLAPDFADAYAYKAIAYRTLANWYEMSTVDAVGRMRPLVNRALTLDPDLPLALLVSVALELYDGRYDEAEQALQLALKQTAQDPLWPRPYAAILLAHCGRFEESLTILDQAIASNPVHPRYLEHYKAQFLWYARRHEAALEVLDQVLAITPNDKRAHEMRGHVLISLHRYEEGFEELSWQFPKQQGWMREAFAEGGLAAVGSGYLRQAEKIADGRIPFTPEETAWRMYVRGHAMLGEPEMAVAWMEHGWSLGDRWEFFYNRVYPWPGFDELRAHPDFRDLMLRTIGDPPTCPGFQTTSTSPPTTPHPHRLVDGELHEAAALATASSMESPGRITAPSTMRARKPALWSGSLRCGEAGAT